MKVSVIVAVYRDIEALSLIVDALRHQTYRDFELVVAEDCAYPEMKAYVESIKDIEVRHTSQEDLGVRKSRSQNNGIMASSGEYLIFIDGDCIPYSTFIERHVSLSKRGRVASGRRVNLGPKYAEKIRNHTIAPLQLEQNYLWYFPFVAADAVERHAESGFSVDPNGLIYKLFLQNRDSSTSILGCNFSCFKDDIVAINGFDEGYGPSPLSDDTDLQWRFIGMGYEIVSCKNVANIFHLYHKRSSKKGGQSAEALWQQFHANQEAKKFVCEKGLNTH